MRQIFSIIIVLAFLLFFSTPPFITLLTPTQEISQSEKRQLTPFPEFRFTFNSIQKFPQSFDKYYNDHFGLREPLVFYQQYFSLKALGISSSPIITIGNDNWLFFNGYGLNALEAYLGLKSKSIFYLELSKESLVSHKDWLAMFGTKYLFVPVPNKMTIYPENLPWRLQKYASIGIYDEIIPYLKKHSNFIDFVDLKEIFVDRKKSKQFYLKTDSHWNTHGAYLAYKTIIRRIQTQEIPIRSVELDEIKWDMIDFSGDLALLLHMNKVLKEKAPVIKSVESCSNRLSKTEIKLQNLANFKPFLNDPRHFSLVQECGDNDTTAIFIHDSFGHFLKPLLSKSFGTIIYVSKGFNSIKDLIEAIKPDVVIDQRIERNLELALALDPQFEDERQKGIFFKADKSIFRLDNIKPEISYIHSPFATVSGTENGVLIASTEEYPSLVFTYSTEAVTAHSVALRIQLTSRYDTESLLYFTSKEKPTISPKQIITLTVKKGYNEFYFSLPVPEKTGKLQFFPGKNAGTYTIHAFDIKY